MNNKDEKMRRVMRLREEQLLLYESILRDLEDKNANVNELYYEYDLEHGRLSAEITAILNSIFREEQS